MTGGVWLSGPILDAYGPTPVGAMLAQLLWLTDGTGELIRADSEWGDIRLSTDQAYRTRRRLITDGWVTVAVRKNAGAPVAHYAGTELLHKLWTKLCTDSAKSRKPRRGSAESSSITRDKQQGFWPHAVAGQPGARTRADGATFLPGTGWVGGAAQTG